MNSQELIASVKVLKPVIYVGEPLAIKVVTHDAKRDEPIEVAINGVPGKSQYLQFASPGRKKIRVVASSRSHKCDIRSLEVQVIPRPDKRCEESLFPIIGISQNLLLKSGATFQLYNPEDFSGLDVYYVWELPKDIRLPSTVPVLDYSFDDQLDPDAPYTNFDITLHVKTRDHKAVYTGRTTLAVWNSYFLNKRRGFIQLKVKSEMYAHRDGETYIGRFTVNNQEPNRVAFSSAHIEYLYDDPERISTPGPPFDYKWTIGPKKTLDRKFTLKVKDLPKDAFGFAVHFRGLTQQKLPAFAHIYFEVRTNPRTLRPIRDPEVLSLLDALRNQSVFRDPDAIRLDQLKRLLDTDPGLRATLQQGRLQPYLSADEFISRLLNPVQDAGPFAQRLMGDSGADDNDREESDPDENDPEDNDPKEGEKCTLADEGDPRGGLVCQLTDDWEDNEVPARIINARKGDVILSPGEDGPVARMLRRLDVPQFHDHAMIMINNFYRLKHSTVSIERLKDLVWTIVWPVPWGAVEVPGLEGWLPDRVKYLWPGTIEQDIGEAVEGQKIDDPDGRRDEDGEIKKYRIGAFLTASTMVNASKQIDPVVVKPPPEVEAQLPEVRQLLHQVADKAKEIDAHYRFYCFTDANIFFEDPDPPPERSWAHEKNYRPTMCSSFIWAAAKSLEEPTVKLEGRGLFTERGELEQPDRDFGAEVDDETRDGLYHYTEANRRESGQVLYDYVYDEVYDEASSQLPFGLGKLIAWANDAADDCANQICNAYASDFTGLDDDGTRAQDSEKWRKPGDGHTVSPDNILFWDAPRLESDGIHGLYGGTPPEPVVYRPARIEGRRRVSRWRRTEGEATLEGHVLYRQEPVSGAYVIAAGRDSVTNGAGEFEMTIPDGSYRVEAGRLINGEFKSTRQDVMNVQVNERRTITLNLEDPPDAYRLITVHGDMARTDNGAWPDDEHLIRNVFMDGIRLGPDNTHAEAGQLESLELFLAVGLVLEFDWQADFSADVTYRASIIHATPFIGTEAGAINVPRTDQAPTRLTIIHALGPLYGDDTVEIRLWIFNRRHP